MPRILSLLLVSSTALPMTTSCGREADASPQLLPPTAQQWSSTWDQGQAELTSYDLEQARYGELHTGHAVLVFVGEDFSRSKQVKLDDPQAAGDDAVRVLKLNHTRKFETGIYPYSVMESVFTPVDLGANPHTLKETMTAQDWCGQAFTQLGLAADGGYNLQSNSYFESDGDKMEHVDGDLLEDELWSRIRIDPSRLPIGHVKLVPSAVDARLRHYPLVAQDAVATLIPGSFDGQTVLTYAVDYTDLDRSLAISFQPTFPYAILGWQEHFISGWGDDAKELTTTAKRTSSLWLDYWTHHTNADAHYRTQLGLD